MLANAEKLFAAAMSAHELLYESDRSAEAALRAALKNLEELARYDPQFAEAVQQLKSARAAVDDVSATVRDYAQDSGLARSAWRRWKTASSAQSPEAEIWPDLEQVIAHGEEVARKLAEVENRDQLLLELRADQAQAAEAYRRRPRSSRASAPLRRGSWKSSPKRTSTIWR